MYTTRPDQLMASLLRVNHQQTSTTSSDAPKQAATQNVFWASAAFSGVRCILQYVVLPFIFPLVGFAANVSEYLFIAISVIAVASMVMSLRRFWRVNYRYRWHYLVVALIGGGILVAHLVVDVRLLLAA